MLETGADVKEQWLMLYNPTDELGSESWEETLFVGPFYCIVHTYMILRCFTMDGVEVIPKFESGCLCADDKYWADYSCVDGPLVAEWDRRSPDVLLRSKGDD